MTLTADSPEVLRLHNAVHAMNAAENALIRELDGATAEKAAALAKAVAVTRAEFEAAFDVVEAMV